MKLRELKHQGALAWPPGWGSAYGPGARFPSGEAGLLTGVESDPNEGCLVVTMEYQGRAHTGILVWDGPPTLAEMERRLRNHVGQPISELSGLRLV